MSSMKKLALVLSVFSYLMFFSHQVSANDIGVAICKSVMNNDKSALRRALRLGSIKLNAIYKDARCNEFNLLQLAFKNKANDVGVFIVKQVSKKKFIEANDVAWAQENGYDASPVFSELKTRVGG